MDEWMDVAGELILLKEKEREKGWGGGGGELLTMLSFLLELFFGTLY